MSSAAATKYMSVEEYLIGEETGDTKHEYYQGEVLAMAGSSITHNQVVSNTLAEINSFLKGKHYQIFQSDMLLHIEASDLFTYPDLSIICGEIEKWQDKNHVITNPVVLMKYCHLTIKAMISARNSDFTATYQRLKSTF